MLTKRFHPTDLASLLKASLCASSLLLLAACGGGGSDGTLPPALQSAEVVASADQANAGGALSADAGLNGIAPAANAADAAAATQAADAAATPAAAPASAPAATSIAAVTGAPPASAAPAAPAPAPATAAASPSAPVAAGNAAMTPFGQDAAKYSLSFSEEFNGGALDTKRWNDKIWYEAAPQTRNYAVEDGKLKIWPQRDASGKFFNRTIDTDGKYYQTYGYFEVEAKLPVGKGTWPAFWLFNHIGERRPEIDVMEAYAGGPAPWGKVVNGVHVPTMFAATIWKDATDQAGMFKLAAEGLHTGFHKYGLKWEPNKLTFYFDGKEFYQKTVSFKDPMYLMLDLWYGSASGQPDNSTPQGKANSYEVNYVRAWKLK